jgi:NRPS condensation-like uncharacterized protein
MKRQLGSNERIVYMNIQAGSINFVVVAHLSVHLHQDHVRKALDILCDRHPLLKTRIANQDGMPFFISDGVPPIPLRVVTRQDDTHWIEEAEHEVNTQLPSRTGPMIRAVLLTSPEATDVLVRFHHVIGDGMSGMYLMRDLLDLSEKISRGIEPSVDSMPERPPMEDLLPPDVKGFNDFIKTTSLIGKQLYSITVQHPKKIPRDDISAGKGLSAHIIHHSFTPEMTGMLVERCRKESATVHGTVCAALLDSVAHLIWRRNGHSSPVTVGCMSAVDMRRFLHPPVTEEVGFYASMVITSHRISKNSEFWNLAREVTESVHHSISKGEPFVFVSLLGKLVPQNAPPSDVAKRASEIYPAALLVTNLGRLDIQEDYEPLQCRAIHFAVSNKAVPDFYNTALVTYKGRLFINFSYNNPILSQEHAKALADETVRTLQTSVR